MERHRACIEARSGREGGSTGIARCGLSLIAKRTRSAAEHPGAQGCTRTSQAARNTRPKARTSARPHTAHGAKPAHRPCGKTRRRCAAPLLVVLLAAGIAPIVGSQMQEAHAASAPALGTKTSGICYIENSWRTNGQTYFNVSGFSGELSGAWAVSPLECLNHTAAAPTYTSASYEAAVSAVDVRAGWVEYSVRITPPGVTDGVSKNEHGLIGYQRVGGTVRVSRSFAGGIELVKTSNDEQLSGNNPCYSLAGASYGVYGDAACSDRRFTMSTDGAGRWKTALDVPVGTYWIKEATPPAGYALDGTTYRVVVDADRYVRVNASTVADEPQVDTADILLEKRDAELEPDADGARPQAGASLARARYEIGFYAGLHSTTDLSWIESTKPQRTWIMQTDERGTIPLAGADGTFADSEGREYPYKVAGDDFYRNARGRIVLPLGTVTVRETTAPEGYLLPEGGRVHVRQVTGGGPSETVRTYVAPVDPEQVARGDVALTKIASAEPSQGDGGIKDTLVGVDFQIVNDNDGAVVRTDGTLATRGEVVTTITTDDRGYASTAEGALPFGSYIVREVASTVPAGYATVEDFGITVTDNGQELYYVLEDGTGTPLRVVKVDAETGKAIAGQMTFRILDEHGQVVSFTRHYPALSHLTAFTTDTRGTCMLPEKLNGGKTYFLQEIAAPEGYVLGPDPIPFTVDGSAGWTWADPLTVTMPDMPQKGRIVVSKTDAERGGPVAHCIYEVRAASDIVTGDGTVHAVAGEPVACIETGADGAAQTDELYLGSYVVAETQQADGYLLDAEPHPVTLNYAGQSVAVTTAALDVTDASTRIEVNKARAGDGAPVEGARFAWWNVADEREENAPDLIDDSEHAENPDGALSPLDRVDEDRVSSGTTDADGRLIVCRLPPGTYGFAEVEAPPGYLADGSVQYITIGKDGLIDGEAAGILRFENDCTKVLVSKTAATTGQPLEGATLELYALTEGEDGEPLRALVERWTSESEPHAIEALPPGDYALHEEQAPDGYLPAEDLVFAVEATTEEQHVELEDDCTKTDIVKVDAATGDPLPGAVLALVDAKGACIDPRNHLTSPAEVEVHELGPDWTSQDGGKAIGWVSEDGPVRFEGLAESELHLVEIEAPTGYLGAEAVAFTVEPTGTAHTVTMADKAEGSLYGRTGAELPPSFAAAAFIALATACAGAAAWRRLRFAG
ncbi:hypothetical protein C2L71_02185 [Enteroscipio rubneri]|uniref:SpaA-like prealbumin fold domain-containing protein n=2 Tax=Enteroscipio rubneri TaxID=2070686 RepID=A0A2K2UEP6_9ACTN|nr:hypothetical protein C2L71_02185 [Enteroscipio rubneri]